MNRVLETRWKFIIVYNFFIERKPVYNGVVSFWQQRTTVESFQFDPLLRFLALCHKQQQGENKWKAVFTMELSEDVTMCHCFINHV